ATDAWRGAPVDSTHVEDPSSNDSGRRHDRATHPTWMGQASSHPDHEPAAAVADELLRQPGPVDRESSRVADPLADERPEGGPVTASRGYQHRRDRDRNGTPAHRCNLRRGAGAGAGAAAHTMPPERNRTEKESARATPSPP